MYAQPIIAQTREVLINTPFRNPSKQAEIETEHIHLTNKMMVCGRHFNSEQQAGGELQSLHDSGYYQYLQRGGLIAKLYLYPSSL